MTDQSPPQLRLSAGAHSVVGKVREHNEDKAVCEPDAALYAVADGLGGHRAGERASQLATEALSATVRDAREAGDQTTLEVLLAAFDRANSEILEDARVHPEREGMGTTLTAVAIIGDRVLLAHVGDSRAWRVRDGSVEQLTRDHTIVAQQLADGIIDAAEAEVHPMRHVLSRCLGVREELEVDLLETDLAADDLLLIASDGIVPGLDLDALVERAGEANDADELARELVETACDRDGGDNITAVVLLCRVA